MLNRACVVATCAAAFGATANSGGGEAAGLEAAFVGHELSSGEGDPSLHDRIAELTARLKHLERSPEEHRLAERRAAEIRRLVEQMVADADTRAGLRSNGLTAGYDGKFFLASADGNFRLEVSGQLQQRYVLNLRQNSPGDDTRGGFEIRRGKLTVAGYVLGPKLAYYATTALSRRTGTFQLEEAWIRIGLTNEMQLKIGQFRSPLLREEQVPSKRQLLVERSLIARRFTQDRIRGTSFRYRTDTFRVGATFMDASDDLFGDQNWIASGRAEVLLDGRWNRLRDFTSFPDDKPTIALGVGILFQDEDRSDPDDDDSKVLRWTADVTAELGGANVFAALVGNHFDEEDHETLNQYGVVVQGGLFLTDEWELFARYVWGDADGEAVDLSVVTVGVNRYFHGHRLKWTADVGYGVSEVGGFWRSSGAGWLRDRRGEEGQVVVRAQLQLLF